MRMPDSESKKAWMAKNTIQVACRLNRNTDKDIFDYYGDRITAGNIKDGLREYIAQHPKK